MNLAQMAWRNIWRRRRRTLITAFSIGFGVLLAATFTGMAVYMYANMIDASAATGFGHVTIEPADYNRTPTLDKRLADSSRLRQQVLAEVGGKIGHGAYHRPGDVCQRGQECRRHVSGHRSAAGIR